MFLLWKQKQKAWKTSYHGCKNIYIKIKLKNKSCQLSFCQYPEFRVFRLGEDAGGLPFACGFYPRQYRLRIGVRPWLDCLAVRFYLYPYCLYLIADAYAADEIYVIPAYLGWTTALIQVFYDTVLVAPLDYSGVFVSIQHKAALERAFKLGCLCPGEFLRVLWEELSMLSIRVLPASFTGYPYH